MSIYAPFAFQADQGSGVLAPWNGTFGTGFNNTTNSIIRNTYDGGLLLTGAFTTYKGNAALRVVKLDSFGTQQTLDTTGTAFASGAGRITCVDPATGRVFCGTTASDYFRCWDASGTTVTGWPVFAGGGISDMKIYGGYLYVVGNFTSVDGNTTYGNFVRINLSTKAVDSSYTYLTKTVTSAGESWYIDFDTANDRAYVGGPFTTIDGVGIRFLYKIVLSTGARDTSWNYNQLVRTSSTALSFSPVVQPDSKVLVGGPFFQKVVSGVTSNGYNVARLNADGTVDTSFAIPSAEIGWGTRKLAVLPDDKILMPGNFSNTQMPSIPGWVGTDYDQNGLIRLLSDGNYDTTLYNPSAMGVTIPVLSRRSITDILVQSDGTFIGTSVGTRWQNGNDGAPNTNFIYAWNGDGTLRNSAYV